MQCTLVKSDEFENLYNAPSMTSLRTDQIKVQPSRQGTVASLLLVCSSPNRLLRARALAGNITLCS